LQIADGVLDGAALALRDLGAMLGQRLLGGMNQRIGVVLGVDRLTRFLSSAALASASLTIFWMSVSDRPPEAWMRICCSLPVALSLAETLTMPLASMSKVTSTCGTPRGAGGKPTRSNWPRILLSAAISRSPWNTR